jgi:hypothetical protein
MNILKSFGKRVKSAGADCDGVVYTMKVLSRPQIGFPFPGVPEVNVVAMIVGCTMIREGSFDPTGDKEDIIALILDKKSPPEVGEEVRALYFYDYYSEPTGARGRYAVVLPYTPDE